MNPFKWIEKKTFLRGASKEYSEIDSKSSTGFGCKLTIFSLDGSNKSACKMRVSQTGSVDYYELTEDAVEAMIMQLEDVIVQRRETNKNKA